MGTKRKIFIPLLITVILLAAFVFAWTCISQNDYVLKINDQKISMSEFEPYLILQKASMEEQKNGEIDWENELIEETPAIESAREFAKQSMVDTVVKVQQAKARKISLTKEEKAELRKTAERYVERLKEYGITVEEFAKMNEDVSLIDKLALDVYKTTDHTSHNHGEVDITSLEKGVAPQDVVEFDSRHILFLTQGLSDEEAAKVKATAEEVLQKILNGADFASLAKQYSEDPGSKDNGGLYENIASGSFVDSYEAAALSLKDGEVYPELVESSYGYHIIKLEKISKPGYLSNTAARSLISKEFSEIAQKWVDDAKVEINEQRYNSAQ